MGIIIVTSIRGLLITLTKVKLSCSLMKHVEMNTELEVNILVFLDGKYFASVFVVFLRNIKQQVFQCYCACPGSDYGE